MSQSAVVPGPGPASAVTQDRVSSEREVIAVRDALITVRRRHHCDSQKPKDDPVAQAHSPLGYEKASLPRRTGYIWQKLEPLGQGFTVTMVTPVNAVDHVSQIGFPTGSLWLVHLDGKPRLLQIDARNAHRPQDVVRPPDPNRVPSPERHVHAACPIGQPMAALSGPPRSEASASERDHSRWSDALLQGGGG